MGEGVRLVLLIVMIPYCLSCELIAKQDTVTNATDHGLGSLRHIITNESSDGDTIRFSVTLDRDTIILTEELVIDKDLVILGNDSTKTFISGDDATRIIFIDESSKLVLQNLTLTKGNGIGNSSSGVGGAIYNLGRLDIINSLLVKNNASLGGAIYGKADTTNVFYTAIRDNSALAAGGVYIHEGAHLNLSSSFIINNKSEGRGGGLFMTGSEVSSVIRNTAVIGNSSDKNGGGIFIDFGAVVSIYNSSIESNTASDDGGGINNFNGSAFLFDTDVLSNTANCGGGIYNRKNVNLYRVKVAANVSSRIGGGMYNLTNLKMKNSVFSGNEAGLFGGAVANNGPSSVITASNSTFSGNLSQVGGAIWNNRGHVIAANTIIAKNTDDGQGPDMTSFGESRVTDLGNNIIGDTTGVFFRFPNSTLKGSKTNPMEPRFMSDVAMAPTLEGDLRLQCASPAIDAGLVDTTGLNIGLTDFSGSVRILGQRIDVGAYESSRSRELYVNQTSITEMSITFEALDHITSDAELDQDIIFVASQTISIITGFKIAKGSMFQAILKECID